MSPIHTANIVQEWFNVHQNEDNCIPCPLHSPYLKIIEHLWKVLECRIQSKDPRPSVKERKDFLTDE